MSSTFLCLRSQKNGTFFKVAFLKAIRAAIDRYLRQAPNNKPWSIVGDPEFSMANKTFNAVCINMMKWGKISPVVHKQPVTREQLQQLFNTGQLGEAETTDFVSTPPNGLVLHHTVFWQERTRKSTKIVEANVGSSRNSQQNKILRTSEGLTWGNVGNKEPSRRSRRQRRRGQTGKCWKRQSLVVVQ